MTFYVTCNLILSFNLCIDFHIGLKLHLRQHHESIFLLGASEKVDPNTLMKPVISDIQNCKRYLLHNNKGEMQITVKIKELYLKLIK